MSASLTASDYSELYARLAAALKDPKVYERYLAFVPQEGLPPVGAATRPPRAKIDGIISPDAYIAELNQVLSRSGLTDTGTDGELNDEIIAALHALDAEYRGALEDLRNLSLAYDGWEVPIEEARADSSTLEVLVNNVVRCWSDLGQPGFTRRLLVAVYAHGQRFGGFVWKEGDKGLINACPCALVVPYLVSLAIFHEAPGADEFKNVDGTPEATSAARRAFATRVLREALVVRNLLGSNEPPVDDPADDRVLTYLRRVSDAPRGGQAVRYLYTYAIGVSERWARNETFKNEEGELRDARPANAAALAAHLA